LGSGLPWIAALKEAVIIPTASLEVVDDHEHSDNVSTVVMGEESCLTGSEEKQSQEAQ
jgi:hypothetical protein